MKLKQALYAVLAVMMIHLGLLLTDGYERFYQIDIFMHIIGGIAVGMIAFVLHSSIKSFLKKSLPLWYLYLFIVGFVMIIGVAWEYHEFFLDQTIHLWYHLPPSQPSLADTIKDLMDDWIGGSIAFWLFKSRV